ncbi:MAG: hypothetical protein P4M04_05600 [Acidobacteriota bacterium]|nr:hypothetical protein [Acidobacteriota bacterium]
MAPSYPDLYPEAGSQHVHDCPSSGFLGILAGTLLSYRQLH